MALPKHKLSYLLRHLSIPRMSLPSTIKAITVPRHGDIDVIEMSTLPFPVQEPNQIIVKVNYAGVNFIDTYHRSGLYPAKSFPVRLGTEASGVIAKLPIDEKVLNDEEYKKRGLSVGSKVAINAPGGMAEYVSIPWASVHLLPPSLSLLIGSASLLQGLTALTFMTETYDVKKGDVVLVHTVAGGLGLIFCQIAKARGATVIGTTSTPEKAELAKANGADHVILYTQEDTVKRVLEITNGEGVNAVFDGVGKDTFEGNFKLIRRKGTIVSVGNASGLAPPFAPMKLTEKNLKIARPTLTNYITTPPESYFYVTELFKLIESGVIKIKVHKEYPFTAEGVQQSQRDLTNRSTTGKLVIKVSDE